jgi:hypothetical protein
MFEEISNVFEEELDQFTVPQLLGKLLLLS